MSDLDTDERWYSLTLNNKLTQRKLNNHVGGSCHHLGLGQPPNKSVPNNFYWIVLYRNIRRYSLCFLIESKWSSNRRLARLDLLSLKFVLIFNEENHLFQRLEAIFIFHEVFCQTSARGGGFGDWIPGPIGKLICDNNGMLFKELKRIILQIFTFSQSKSGIGMNCGHAPRL